MHSNNVINIVVFRLYISIIQNATKNMYKVQIYYHICTTIMQYIRKKFLALQGFYFYELWQSTDENGSKGKKSYRMALV